MYSINIEWREHQLTHLHRVDSSNKTLGLVCYQQQGVWLVFIKQLPVFNANSAYPDQAPHSAVSDLGLQCLPVAPFWGLQAKMG